MALIEHKRARFDYEILETFEAGLVLIGTEVKSLRKGQGKLEGAHVVVRGGEAFLVGSHIPAIQVKNAPAGFDPLRTRKLMVSQKEMALLSQKSDKQGLTIVPLSVYNKGRNLKLSIAIARGKKKYDKRETLKERDTKRSIERKLKGE
jgi:SsrA-binding protein